MILRMEVIMHNLISHNQLEDWSERLDRLTEMNKRNELINDYYSCIIECQDNEQICKQICRELLKNV